MTAYNQGRPFGASFDYGQPLPYLHHTAPAPSYEHQPQQRQQQQQRGMMYGGQRGHMHHTTRYPSSQASSAYASPNAYYDASQQQMAGQQYQHQPPQQQQLFQQQQHAYQAYPHQQLQQRQHQLDLGHAQSVHGSNSKLTEERAHLDRLFSALSAAPSASSGLYAGAAQAVPNFAGGAQAACSGCTADLRTVPTEQQHHQHSHWPSSAYGHNHNPLVGYGQTAQLSLPPVLPAPHQGAGLRPALNLEGLGNGQTQSRRSSREFMRTHHHHHQQQQQQYVDGPAGFTYSQSEVAIEAPLPNSAMRQVDAYHQSLPPHMVNAHQQAQYAIAPSHMWGSFVQQEANGNAYAPMQAELAMPQKEVTLDDEPQLIAPDASAIPPPPPIEKSAYPLAALATDLVWDAFLSAASHNSGLGSSPSMPSSGAASPIHQSHFRDADMQQGHASSPLSGFGISSHVLPRSYAHPRASATSAASRPRQGRSLSPQVARTDRHGSAEVCESSSQANAGNVYGAIGGERKPRPSNLATSVSPSSRSDSSSPASTAPGTPATEASVNCLVKTGSDNSLGSRTQSRFTGAGIGTPFWGEDSHSEQVNHSKDMLFSLSGPSMNHLRSSAPYGNHSRYMQDLSPPAALFEQIQKLLGATLLSQQVLLLALYFVGKTPHTSALYPPATSQSALKSTSAPFKLLLAALVVANKHLDDNSFRNSTFAQVANVTLPEVNALEYSMLAGLEFDVNVSAGDWLAWLQNLQYSRVTPFTPEPSRVEDTIGRMLVDAHQQSQDHENRFGFRADVVLESSFSRSEAASPAHRPRQLDHATVMDVPVVPLSPAPSDMSSLVSGGTFDMDASGPLEREQRPRYAKAFDAGTSKVPSPHQYGLGVFGGAYRPITVA